MAEFIGNAYGGIAGLGERTGYYKGEMAKQRKKRKDSELLENYRKQRKMEMSMPNWREPVNYPYKSREDIPEDVLAMFEKDPVFDLDTFLTKVGWSDADKTRIQAEMKKTPGWKKKPWGAADHFGNMILFYQKFGKGEPIGDGLLTLKAPKDEDKVNTILHEMRHAKMREPWFMKSSAVPKYVREELGEPGYSYQKYDLDPTEDPHKNVYGEELYNRYLDQYFGDVAEKGTIAGSSYKPYFDKILRDEWEPHAKAYKDILKEEKRVLSKPKFRKQAAGGGRVRMASGGIVGILKL